MSNAERAQTLIEALPYIQKYYGNTIVVKYGGNAMVSEELCAAVISDIVLLSLVGIRVIVVHGGGPDINAMLDAVGKEGKFVNGLRYTDEETMDIVQMVLCGKVNKNLVNLISETGGDAVGISGMDCDLIEAKKLDKGDGFDYGLVGEIVKINPQVIKTTLEAGVIPVVSTVAKGVDGNKCYNINADTAAAEIASALGAEKLILMTDIKGVLRDPSDEDTLIRQILLDEIPDLKSSGILKGGMIPKIDCCETALKNGVSRTHILDGRVPHSILIEVLSHKGIGTMVWKGDND
ncbi:MAG: acetylglutamate kinase [Clostridia bacterium]|nr:acetylglutamate kinase [Clostridia bacterium]